MINFEDIKKVITDLEQYVSSLKTVTETQLSLEKSSVELSEIRQKLEGLMNGVKDFSDIAKKAEQMRNETLSTNFASVIEKISGIGLQIDNRLNEFQKILLDKEEKDSKRNKALICILLFITILLLSVIILLKFM